MSTGSGTSAGKDNEEDTTTPYGTLKTGRRGRGGSFSGQGAVFFLKGPFTLKFGQISYTVDQILVTNEKWFNLVYVVQPLRHDS